VSNALPLDLTLLPGARGLLARHAQALPQRDELCGAFAGALALTAAGVEDYRGEPVDQDTVALAAGSVISAAPQPQLLPSGEAPRRDYRLRLPTIADPERSGTTAAGLGHALQLLSAGALVAIPYSGPWNVGTLAGLFDLAAAAPNPLTLIANFATRHLWGARPALAQLLGYLVEGRLQGPEPDWDVGHFACVVGSLSGPGGRLYALADTYPVLGNGGVHCQPQERLAAALERRGGPGGGVFVLAFTEDAPAIRHGGKQLGMSEGVWDNGTVTVGAPR
jgi:hypothetical protein